MGGYYARHQGYPAEVADAIRDHYKPVGQGDEVPTAPVTVAVSLADKLDTIAAFFAIDEKPTGSKDPFALRRSAISAAQIIIRNGLRLSLGRAFVVSYLGWVEGAVRKAHKTAFVDLPERAFSREGNDLLRVRLIEDYLEFAPTNIVHDFSKLFDLWNIYAGDDIADFSADRLKVQQREAGVRHDLIDAVFALGGEDDLVRLLARVKALQSFIATEDGANLLAGYKLAANIVRIEAKKDETASSPPVTPAKAGVQVTAMLRRSSDRADMDASLRWHDGTWAYAFLSSSTSENSASTTSSSAGAASASADSDVASAPPSACVFS